MKKLSLSLLISAVITVSLCAADLTIAPIKDVQATQVVAVSAIQSTADPGKVKVGEDDCTPAVMVTIGGSGGAPALMASTSLTMKSLLLSALSSDKVITGEMKKTSVVGEQDGDILYYAETGGVLGEKIILSIQWYDGSAVKKGTAQKPGIVVASVDPFRFSPANKSWPPDLHHPEEEGGMVWVLIGWDGCARKRAAWKK